MPNRKHVAEALMTVDPAWGLIRHVIATADNLVIALVAETKDERYRLIYGGRVVHEDEFPHEITPFSLSFDGTKFAHVVRGKSRGGRSSAIFVNGEKLYEVPFGTVHYFDWIDGWRLALSAWNDDDLRARKDGIHVYLNDEDVTGHFDFEPVLMDRMRHAVRVRELDTAYMVYDDGSHSKPIPVRSDEDSWSWSNRLTPPKRMDDPSLPKTLQDRANRKMRVSYRGQSGPWFDQIESFGGMREFAFSADGTRLAYVGVNYSGIARALSGLVGRAFRSAEDREEDDEKPSRWAMLLARLFTPYGGPGYAYIEGSRRYVPVDDNRSWKKRYRFAGDHFYTPTDELVVTAETGNGVRVVIDEDEGPTMQDVHNVRCLPDGRVTYVGRRGDAYLRVVVEG